MSANQPTSELTTRDVLSQVDRRVSLIETDVRDLREHLDARFDETARHTSREFTELRRELEHLRNRGDVRFRWTIGLILVSWLSTVGTNLIR